jgi:DNA-binding NtrC family response regulator
MTAEARILVVDDEPSVLNVLTVALLEQKWSVTTARSTEEAMPIVERERFDLFLVDKNLGALDGVELTRAIRARDRRAAIVLMTGYGSSRSAADALNAGVDAYVEKPFRDIFELVSTVARLLAERGGEAPAPAAPQPSAGALRIMVASPASNVRRQLRSSLEGLGGETSQVGAAGEAATVTRVRQPDLVVIDGAGYGEELPALVRGLMEGAPRASLVVVARSLSLPLLKRLIELRVRSFIDVAPDSRDCPGKLRAAVDRLRSRRAVEELLKPEQ